MRWLFKWAVRLVLLAFIAIIILALSLDPLLKALAESRIRASTGMDAKIGKFSVGLLSPVVTLQDFKLYNPPDFGGTPFLDIPELHVEYDRAALAEGKLRLRLVRFNLAELDVVVNESGRTNLDAVKRDKLLSALTGVAGIAHLKAFGWGTKPIEFDGIDALNFSFGKARFIDLKDPKRNRQQVIGLRGH